MLEYGQSATSCCAWYLAPLQRMSACQQCLHEEALRLLSGSLFLYFLGSVAWCPLQTGPPCRQALQACAETLEDAGTMDWERRRLADMDFSALRTRSVSCHQSNCAKKARKKHSCLPKKFCLSRNTSSSDSASSNTSYLLSRILQAALAHASLRLHFRIHFPCFDLLAGDNGSQSKAVAVSSFMFAPMVSQMKARRHPSVEVPWIHLTRHLQAAKTAEPPTLISRTMSRVQSIIACLAQRSLVQAPGRCDSEKGLRLPQLIFQHSIGE